MRVVGVELVRADRASFSQWWPQHLTGLNGLIDTLYLRVDPVQPPDLSLVPRIDYDLIVEPQNERTGRFFREDVERQACLDWALTTDASWCVTFDADEVIYSGTDEMRSFMAGSDNKLWGVQLTYVSHHRPGYVLPRSGIRCWRGFRLTRACHDFRYQADADGLHSGSIVPYMDGKRKILKAKVLHYHATSCQEYMAERTYYDNTIEVAQHGGIDFLYRCDRFGNEMEAKPLQEWLAA